MRTLRFVARAEVFNADGEQIFDELAAAPPQHTRGAFTLEVTSSVSGHPLEAWLCAVGHVPEMTSGRYRWTFDTQDEARAAEQRAVAALRDVPAHLRGAARSCTVRTLAMMLTELPTTSFASPGH